MKVTVAELVKSCARPSHFPPLGLPEVAFLGRSNVGKSSLLNRLAKRKKLARTSSTPGKTRLITFFRVIVGGAEVHFVDLPGYGWARVSRGERDSWRQLVESYLGERATLGAAVLLQDLRRDISEDEELLLAWLAERGVPAIVAITKVDKLKPMRRAERLRKLMAQLPEGTRASTIATSSQSGAGIDELWRLIHQRLFSAGPGAGLDTGSGRTG